MAISFGGFSTFLPVETVSFANSPTSVTVRLGPVNLRGVRTVTISATSKPATDTRKFQPRDPMKPRRVSPEMQEFLGGVSEIRRTHALKEIWAHIKQHNLRDPKDRMTIICDEKLKKILGGRDRIGHLEIARLIHPHFLE